jgi:hypothetical protein
MVQPSFGLKELDNWNSDKVCMKLLVVVWIAKQNNVQV